MNYNTDNDNNTPASNVGETDISIIKETITNRNTIIFCRVSSYGQTGPYCVSFDLQEHKGYVCSRLFALKVMGVTKVVESAYQGKTCTIKSLITLNKGKNIIIYNVSRFSRNVTNGLELLDYALKCNTRLFFVEEGIVWDKNNTNNRNQLQNKLYLAQEESRAIGRRVKDALALKKRQGYFTGGIPKYGYKVVDSVGGRRAIPDKYEQAVIKFINLCRTVGTSVRTLNEWMRILSPTFDDLIELEYDGRAVRTLQEPLSYEGIADLLNEYNVTKRNRQWSKSMVSAICRQDYENILEGMINMSF
jgi:DNA invertase Pin-like site-specific DNA recombinase